MNGYVLLSNQEGGRRQASRARYGEGEGKKEDNKENAVGGSKGNRNPSLYCPCPRSGEMKAPTRVRFHRTEPLAKPEGTYTDAQCQHKRLAKETRT